MKKILLLCAAMIALLFVSCKPNADVEKWFNSASTVELTFSNCNIANQELWDKMELMQSDKYRFVYDKATSIGYIEFDGGYYQMDHFGYNKFKSHQTCVALDNVGADKNVTLVEIIPSGKNYIMSVSIIPYKWGTWEHVANFTQEKGAYRTPTPSIEEGPVAEPGPAGYAEWTEDDEYNYYHHHIDMDDEFQLDDDI